MKNIFILLFILLLSACATTRKFEKNLNTWIGLTDIDLISQIGPPTRIFELSNGSKILIYGDRATPTMATYQVGYGMYSVDTTAYCTTQFTIDPKGIIKEWRHEGNNCVST